MSNIASADRLFDEIAVLFATRGGEAYGEGVSIAEHSLQTAALAQAEGAEPALVVAALLHDIGHLISPPDDAFGYHRHDQSGGAWLAERFPPSVSEPVRLHVAAKRYLCATQADYYDRLSKPSQHSLSRQGGAMSASAAEDFARHAFADWAVRLRQWDDLGKAVGTRVSGLDFYRPAISACAGEHQP